MPGCAAIGCNNRSEKGFTMKCFPRDPVLRKIWKHRVGRADWEPSNNSFLCHVHFDPKQWIIPSNGKIKLKKGALPSIFTVTSTRKSPKKKLNSKLPNRCDDEEDEDYEVEYLENDTSFIFNMVNNDKEVPSIMNMQSQDDSSINSQILQNVKIIGGDALKDLQNENIIIVADDNDREIGKIVNNTGFFMVENERGKENVRILPKPDKSTEIKVEVKEETAEHNSNVPDYDEIEEKLKEICNENNANNSKNDENFEKKDTESLETQTILCVDDLEINRNNLRENSDEEIELNSENNRSQMRLKRKVSESLSHESTKSIEPKNKFRKSKSIEDISDIIHDLENESPEENKSHKLKLVSMVSSLPSSTNKPIIKNDIQVKLKNGIINRSVANKKKYTAKVSSLKFSDQSTIEKLTNKVNTQAEVIQLLTNQLISYKDMSRKMQCLVQDLHNKKKKIDALTQKLSEKNFQEAVKTSKIDSGDFKKNTDESDLKNKIESLDENNKKLIKNLNAEAQNRRKLELQIKSRDNQIKELNWKLEKASKYLDRAEKNTNNYKKKMSAMQAFIRRKQLSTEKNSTPFDEFLIGQLNKNYSEESIKKALEIEQACGSEGYKILLKHEFPLPDLNELRKKNAVEDEEEEEEKEEEEKGKEEERERGEEEVMILEPEDSKVQISATNIKMENIEYLDETDLQQRLEDDGSQFFVTEFLNDSNETVTGTVQDIFNETDDEDVNLLSDLRKHNILIELDD